MQPRVLITRPIPQEAIDRVAAHFTVQTHSEDAPMPLPLLIDSLHDAEAVMPCGLQLPEEAIAAAPRLRVVANIGAGYDNIDLVACGRRKIIVTNTPDVLSEATADLAFALLLSAARRVVEGDRNVRAGNWPHWQWTSLWGAELHGKTLGIYGCGRIGQAVAHRGRGFSMRLLYHSRNRIAAAIEKELRLQWVEFPVLLAESDFLSVHAPLTPATSHSVSQAEFRKMKPTSFLINTARGPIVDEEALVQALRAGRLGGAGLDVFENEPKVHPDLLAMNNVVLLPHIGSATGDTRLRMAMLAVDNLLAALKGDRPPNLVNPEVWDSNP